MLEYVAKAAQTHLQAELANALDDIEAEWTAEDDPITLDNIETWHLGFLPTVVELPQSSFPVLTTVAGDEDPAADPLTLANQWGYGEGTIPLIINWFVYDTDEEISYKKCLRYGQAVAAVMRAHRKLATGIHIETRGFVPQTRSGELAREFPEVGSTVFYTWMGQQTWPVRVRHTT
jgi:hypothetical protein